MLVTKLCYKCHVVKKTNFLVKQHGYIGKNTDELGVQIQGPSLISSVTLGDLTSLSLK